MENPLIAFLKNLNFEYRILHNPQQIFSGVYSDIDIVIPKSKIIDFEKYLSNNDFLKPIKLVFRKNGYYFITHYIENEKVKLVPIDVITDYVYNNLFICSNQELLKDKIIFNGLKCVPENIELKYLLTKRIFKGEISGEQREKLRKLITISTAKSIFSELLGKKLGLFLYDSISNNDWDSIQKKLKAIKKALKFRLFIRNPIAFVSENLNELKRIFYRIKNPTGFILVIMGSDGAGKSTLINNLIPRISPLFRGIIKYHLRPTLKIPKNAAPPVTDPHNKAPWPFPISYIKLFYFSLIYVIGYYLLLKIKLIRTNLIIFDRYYDDIFVDKLRYRFKGSDRLLRIFKKLIPEPDLYLILDADEETILKRKKELNISELREQRIKYINLQAQLRYSKIIDATASVDQIVDEAFAIITDMLYAKYIVDKNAFIKLGENKSSDDRLSKSNYYSFLLKDGREYLIPKSMPTRFYKYFNLYNPQNFKGRLVKNILFNFSSFKLGNLILKSKKIDKITPSNLPLEDLNKIVLENFGESNYYYNIGCGTPGAGRKPVVQVVDEKLKTICYVKIGHNEDTRKSLQNEKEVLKKLKNEKLVFKIPNILFDQEFQGNYLLFLEPVSFDQSLQGDLREVHLEVLNNLFEISNYEARFIDSNYFKEISGDISLIKNSYYKNYAIKILNNILSHTNNEKIKFCLNHGDFCPWNLSYSNKKLYILDWELSSFNLPTGYDFFHFIVQYYSLIRKTGIAQIIDEIEKSFNNPSIKLYLSTIGINENNYSIILKLYLLHKFVYYVLRSLDNDKIHKFQTLLFQLEK